MASPLQLSLLLSLALATDASAQEPTPRGGQPASGRVFAQGAEEDIKLLERFDADGNGVLDQDERQPAREYIQAHPELRPPFRRGRSPVQTGSPGPKVGKDEVEIYPESVDLYDGDSLRTIFVDFEHENWEEDLAAFWHTDVLVPATLTVDKRLYEQVGMSFRGNNSFTGVPAGLKRPFSIRMDAWRDQNLLGHRALNLLNSNEDPTYLRSVLYLLVARDYIPALQANLLRVVINGESWGIYVNQQTFSAEFEQATFGNKDGTRWKSPNNSTGGGLGYLGEDTDLYRRWYEMKDKDDLDAWRALRDVTKIIDQAPIEELEGALAESLNLDAVLRFLAIDMALINYDGYWRDGSDFNVYLGTDGKLICTPHDANEGFRVRVRRNNTQQPEPLAALDDPNKALRHRLLAVPELRRRYLVYVGEIAEKWLDWDHLGPIVEKYQQLIAADVAADNRKLDTTEAFTTGVYGPGDGAAAPLTSIKGFADGRRAFLLAHPEIVAAGK